MPKTKDLQAPRGAKVTEAQATQTSSKSASDRVSGKRAVARPSQVAKESLKVADPAVEKSEKQSSRKPATQVQDSNRHGVKGNSISTVGSMSRNRGESLPHSGGSSTIAEKVDSQALHAKLSGYPDLRTLQGVRECVGKDSSTNVQTHYQFQSSRQGKSPNDQGSGNNPNDNHGGSSRRFKETPGETESKYPGQPVPFIADGQANEYYEEYKKCSTDSLTPGTASFRTEQFNFTNRSLMSQQVFQMLIVPPSRSHMSSMTPFTQRIASRTYARKYAIIDGEAPNSNPGFLALPIITNNGEGVAAIGAIKRHHTIIHTSRDAPQPQPNEAPRRTQGGVPEAPMLPYPIRVRPRYPGTEGYALDPMARLNFGRIESFDYGVKVKLLGKVHENSMQWFDNQFRLVWPQRQVGVAEHHNPTSTVSPQSPQTPQLLAAPTISTHNSTVQVADPSGVVSPSHNRNDSGITFPGPISIDMVNDALDRIRLSAESHRLPAPPDLDNAGLTRLAQNHAVRVQFFEDIEGRWRDLLGKRARQAE